MAKEVFEHVFDENVDPAAYVEEHGLKMDNDSDAIKGIVETVVANNPQSVADYKAGKEKAVGFLVGQVMKETKGKANPQVINQMLTEVLESM